VSEVYVVDTGAANVASVLAALTEVGATVVRGSDAARVRAAARVVLPGVGAFGAVRSRMDEALAVALAERVRDGRPTFGICLGMQLFSEGSEESPGVPGLGVLPTSVGRFSAGIEVPQLGWNGVVADGEGYLTDGAAYFANSFRITRPPPGWRVAWTSYGDRFAAGLERGDVVLVQFHPELSGGWGLELLRRWVRGTPATNPRGFAPGSLTRRIIPCLDVRDGRVVKGVQFQGLRDAGDPASLAAAYAEQGADELCILDVSATPEGRRTAADTVAKVRARVRLPVTVGGGVRSVEDARRLLDAGADKVGINTAAVNDPGLIETLATALGSQCVVLAVDAARTGASGWEVVTRSGRDRRGLDAVEWCREGARRGAGEVLLTSWDRDGSRSGYDLALVQAVSEAVPCPVIASGGANSPAHLAEAFRAGASAALAASIFHDGDTTVEEVKVALARLGVQVRTQQFIEGGAA
jgi:cyclase